MKPPVIFPADSMQTDQNIHTTSRALICATAALVLSESRAREAVTLALQASTLIIKKLLFFK